jgi:hypothetical protein
MISLPIDISIGCGPTPALGPKVRTNAIRGQADEDAKMQVLTFHTNVWSRFAARLTA